MTGRVIKCGCGMTGRNRVVHGAECDCFARRDGCRGGGLGRGLGVGPGNEGEASVCVLALCESRSDDECSG